MDNLSNMYIFRIINKRKRSELVAFIKIDWLIVINFFSFEIIIINIIINKFSFKILFLHFRDKNQLLIIMNKNNLFKFQ